jgi:hypothetical protein
MLQYQETERASRETEKVIKYTFHTTGIEHMWNIKTTVIPVIKGATETISKSFRKYLSNIPGKHNINELQNTAILSTAHTLWKVSL